MTEVDVLSFFVFLLLLSSSCIAGMCAQVEAGQAVKEKGNKAFKEGKLPRAIRLYEKVGSLYLIFNGF